MKILTQSFTEHLAEIDAYLDFLTIIGDQAQLGPPKIGTEGKTITTSQQKILYSSVYLQLYNLIESTITRCIDILCDAVSEGSKWQPADLSINLRKEWVRYLARTHTELNYENRLISSLSVCDHLINAFPVKELKIKKGSSGNWDDIQISQLAKRVGCSLTIDDATMKNIKMPYRDDKGALAFIVKRRNDLAHGAVSFVECGDVAVADLCDLKERTAAYLQDVVNSFEHFIDSHGYLQETSRPVTT